jgi:hypothetical protein
MTALSSAFRTAQHCFWGFLECGFSSDIFLLIVRSLFQARQYKNDTIRTAHGDEQRGQYRPTLKTET